MTTHTATYSGPKERQGEARALMGRREAKPYLPVVGYHPITEEPVRGKEPEHFDSVFPDSDGLGWVTLDTDDLDVTTAAMAEVGYALRLHSEIGQPKGASSLVLP